MLAVLRKPMAKTFRRSLSCTAVLLCASVLVARADEAAPTPPRSEAEWKAWIASQPPPPPPPIINQPLTFSSPTISLITTPSSKTDVTTFLKTPVSFKVKDASFLSAFDAVLTASGKACPIECRNIKPMKVTLGTQGDKVGEVLDTLAKMGGASLWLLPNKLLLCPATSLSDKEKYGAKPWSVLISKSTFPAGKLLAGKTDYVAMLNTKISASSNGDTGDAGFACLLALSRDGSQGEHHVSFSPMAGPCTNISVSFEDITYGEALGALAHMDGNELYVLPDHLLISPVGGLTPEEQKIAIPAFTYPGFGKPEPSAPNS